MKSNVPLYKAIPLIVKDHLFFLCIFMYHLVGAILNIFLASMLYLGFYLILRGYSDANGGEHWPVIVQMAKWVYIGFMVLSVVGGLVVKTNEQATSFAGIGSRLCM